MQAIAARSSAERMQEFEALLRHGNEMEAAALRRLHPDYSDREIFLCMVRRRYGDELALEVWPQAATVDP